MLAEAWANYRDESFVQQFLSPAVIRRFRMFAVTDKADDPYYLVSGIHDERGGSTRYATCWRRTTTLPHRNRMFRSSMSTCSATAN